MFNYFVQKNVNYRWIYGLLIAFLTFFIKNTQNVFSLDSRFFLVVSIVFFVQYFLLNLLFSFWVYAKKNTLAILIVGFFMDIVLVSGLNYFSGGFFSLFVFLYLVLLMVYSFDRLLHNISFFIILMSYQAILYFINQEYFLSSAIVNSNIVHSFLLALFYLLIKLIIANNNYKLNPIVHNIRNSLTVILGYVNLLNSYNNSEQQSEQYYDAIEVATLKIKDSCDEYTAIKNDRRFKKKINKEGSTIE